MIADPGIVVGRAYGGRSGPGKPAPVPARGGAPPRPAAAADNRMHRIECRFRRFRATSPPVPALRGRGGAILAAMPADAQPPAPDGPLIVQSDKSVLLEVARPGADEARRAIEIGRAHV